MFDSDADPRFPQEARRYRIAGVLGRGGFGTVYLARLEGPEEFVKDVAIKILSDPSPPRDVLTRFRDEARILGRLRDRNIVSVDPPIQLNGRWAVVMEFVEGMDCRRLLRSYERLPPLVALGIVEEVARTLDNLWHHPGDEGQPMQLLHRDLKPGNIQITPTGTIKLLDFGVARASMAARETETTHHIGGTIGYIAPERLDGIEDHPGDVYSLGVVLEELVTGVRPTRPGDDRPEPEGVDDEALAEALRLAAAMRMVDPAARPPAAEVEQRCREALRRLEGPTLRSWARDHVQARPDTAEDPLVGRTLSETLSRVSRDSMSIEAAAPAPRRRWGVILGVLGVAVVLAVVLFLAGGLGGAGAGFLLLRSVVAPPAVIVPPPAPLPVPVVEDEEVVEEVDEEDVEEVEDVEEEPPKRVQRPRPAPLPTGTVAIDGDADAVELVGEQGSFGPGSVPAGSYTVRATFGGRTVPAGTVVVQAGEAIALRCDGRFKRCMPR